MTKGKKANELREHPEGIESKDSPPATEGTPKKAAISQCVCKNGQYIIRPMEPGSEPAKKIIHPLNLSGDPRFFVKNGEIVRPFLKVEFGYLQTLEIAGIDVAIYEEVGVGEFDPGDMQPISLRSLDEDFKELNAAPAE